MPSTFEKLDVGYRVRGRNRPVLRGLDLSIGAGETYGLVGESGCGKSTAAMAAMRYLSRNGKITAGRILIDGQDVTSMPPGDLQRLRAQKVSMVYQDPGRALNPSIRAGRQLEEVFGIAGASEAEARTKALDMLRRVRITDPERVMDRYPHQLSGGMQQRIVIAMALAVERKLIILDEPTTGLDATVEAEVLDLIEALRAEHSTAVLFIGHNLGVIARMCSRVGVLYAGRLVEEGPTAKVFADPRHPYTVGLLRCLPKRGLSRRDERLDTIPGFLPPSPDALAGCIFHPRCALAKDLCRTTEPPLIGLGDGRLSRCHFHEEAPHLPRATRPDPAVAAVSPDAKPPVLTIEKLGKTFAAGPHKVHALRDITLDLRAGETLGLVGESGSGKTTLARVLLGLMPPDTGSVLRLDGAALPPLPARRNLEAVQIVFQNPDSALNRAHTIRRIIGRALERLAKLSGKAVEDRMLSLTRGVQLADRYLSAKPRQLSGGLKQRVAIARAFAGTAEARRLRRADLGARRLGPGRDPQPSGRPAGGARHELSLHLARPRRRALSVGPHRRTLSRAADGDRPRRQGLRRPASSLYGSVALGRAAARRHVPPRPPRGRNPERRQSTGRLRLSHALSAPYRPDLRHGGAAAERARCGTFHPLPSGDGRDGTRDGRGAPRPRPRR